MTAVRDAVKDKHTVSGDDTGTYQWVFADQDANTRDAILDLLAGPAQDETGEGEVPQDAPYQQVWSGREPDAFEKTQSVAEYGDAPFLVLLDSDEEILAYDLSYRVTPERLDELEGYAGTEYPEEMKQLVTDLEENGVDAAYVYHLAVHPDLQGQAFGLQAPTIRQTVLEADWEDGETPPATAVYEHITGQQFAVDAEPEYTETDAVLSLVKRYADPETEEPAQVYKISQGFGFEDTGIIQEEDGDVYSLMMKHDPEADVPSQDYLQGDTQ